MGEERVRDFFLERGIEKKIVRFDKTTENSYLAAQTLGVEVGMIAKSILFMVDGLPNMIVISGDKRVDEKRVKNLLNAKKVKMAKPDEVFDFTGFEVGGVSPVGHKTVFPVFVDVSLKRYSEIFPAAGEHNNMFPSTFDELIILTDGKPVDVAKE